MPEACPAPSIVFPLPIPAARSFANKTDEAGFGHNRDGGGRTHAAVDLYAPAGTPVLAVADGKVVRIAKEFYPPFCAGPDARPRTGAIEVAHEGLGIIRYGETDPLRTGWLVREKLRVKKGTILGFVGNQGRKYNARHELVNRETMLHLEWYADWEDQNTNSASKDSHPLSHPGRRNYPYLAATERNGQYDRRADLKNPTALMTNAPLARFANLSNGQDRQKLRNRMPPSSQALEALLRTAPSMFAHDPDCIRPKE